MKKLILFLTTLLLLNLITAFCNTGPEKVVSIRKVVKPHAWYVQQANLWEQEIEKDPSNADAWMNYYTANRMAKITGKVDEPADRHRFSSLDHIVKRMEKSVPNSFEYHYIKWYNGNGNTQLFGHLEKAFEIDPFRTETYYDFILYYELTGERSRMAEFCKKLFNRNDISPALLAYNYNVLQSLEGS